MSMSMSNIKIKISSPNGRVNTRTPNTWVAEGKSFPMMEASSTTLDQFKILIRQEIIKLAKEEEKNLPPLLEEEYPEFYWGRCFSDEHPDKTDYTLEYIEGIKPKIEAVEYNSEERYEDEYGYIQYGDVIISLSEEQILKLVEIKALNWARVNYELEYLL